MRSNVSLTLSALATLSILCLSLGTVLSIYVLLTRDNEDTKVPRRIFGVIAPIFTVGMFFAPVSLVRKGLRTQVSSVIPINLIICFATCNCLGIAYGVRSSLIPVVVANLFGAIFQAMWIVAWISIVAQGKMWRMFVLNTTILAVNVFVLSAALNIKFRHLSLVAATASVIPNFAPIVQMRAALNDHDLTGMSTALSVSMFGTNAAWTLYGLTAQDSVVGIPAVFGLFLATAQILTILALGQFPIFLPAIGQVLCAGSTVPRPYNHRDLNIV